jgi:hypothetical protein
MMEQTSLETLAARLAAVEERLATAEQARQGTERRLRWWKGVAGFLFLCGLLLCVPHLGQAQGGTVEQRLAVVEGKLARVFVVNGGNDIIISGANLNLINGGGSTQTTNGLGNLILGYNEARGGGADFRTGSHNLVIGQQGNYTSFGGIIGGYQNTIAGPFAHALTGFGNGALSFYSCISTGNRNNATGNYAAILGGEINVASGEKACVSAGFNNTASGKLSSVSGGDLNTASGTSSSVIAGFRNTASGPWSSVSGGQDNTTSGDVSSVSGGANRSSTGPFDWRAGSLFEEL